MGLTAFNRMRRRNSEHVAQPAAEEPATASFPDDCPGYDVLVENGLLTEEQVKNHEDLTALKGIGKKTQENIYAFFGWSPTEPDDTEPQDPPSGGDTPDAETEDNSAETETDSGENADTNADGSDTEDKTPEGTADGETDAEDADEEESGEDTAAEEPGEDEYPKKLDGGVKLFSDGSKEQMSMEAAIKHEAELSGE